MSARCSGGRRTLAFWAAVLALVGLASAARAESIYRYRDPNTKREVFVTRLDQVPPQYRQQAKLVVSDGVLVDSSNQPDKDVPLGTVIYAGKNSGGVLETIERAFRDAMASGLNVNGLYRTLTTAIDTALVGAGRRPLSAAEVAQVRRMLAEAATELAVAGLLSVVALILVMGHAFRAGHRWWMVFILLFQLPGIAYVLIHVEGKRRWFKFATLFAQAAPYAVALATGWRLFSWFRAILAGSPLW
jgi:hypothetical protein